jgi:hypothetical protein
MQEQLHQLLSLSNICSIYIVDDAIGDNNVTQEHFVSLVLNVNGKGRIEELNTQGEELHFEQDSPVLEEYSGEVWNSASGDEQLRYVEFLCRIVLADKDPTTIPENAQDLATNLDVTRVLDLLRQDQNLSKMELVAMKPTEWDKEITKISGRIPEGQKAIVLFDQKLALAGGRFVQTEGTDLVWEIVDGPSKHLSTKFLPGILSYTVPNQGLELTYRAEMAQKRGMDVNKLFVLTKQRLANLGLFIDGLKKLMLNEPCEQIKNHAIEVGAAALKSTDERLRALDTYDFSHTVLKSSSKEGVWAPETLFRIIDIIYKDEIKKQLLDRNLIPSLNELLDKATALSSIEIPIDYSVAQTEKYELRRQEMYAKGKLINGLYKPIENGDIFEVEGKGKGKYILLSQPCDLVVRSSGPTKGSRTNKVAYLLEIVSFDKELLSEKLEKTRDRKSLAFNYWQNRGMLDYFEQSEQLISVVNLFGAQVVNLDVLDLIMFNKEGVATIDTAAAIPEALHIGLTERFSKLKKGFESTLIKMNQHREVLKAVKKHWQEPLVKSLLPCLSVNDKLGKQDQSGTTFSFGIKRIKSLRDPYAKNLLDKYTRYLSRTGDLHDFTEVNEVDISTNISAAIFTTDSDAVPASDLAQLPENGGA